MTIESANDRAVFFDTDEFGVVGTFTGLVGTPTVNGMFDQMGDVIGRALGNVNGVQSGQPQFTCRTADLPGTIADGVILQISGTDYVVRHRDFDGVGICTIFLEEQLTA